MMGFPIGIFWYMWQEVGRREEKSDSSACFSLTHNSQMALIGEYICMRRELQEIPITTMGFGASPASPPLPSTSFTPSRWGKSSEGEERDGLASSAGGFGGVVGVSGTPLGDFVGNPAPSLREGEGEREGHLYGSGEIPRFGSGEFTPRFGSGLGFNSVYHTPPSPTPSSVSINISL
jgi:hypothetical protein